ncbi:MAG: response regulator, partial [Bacteroidota bacterium]|nr:response regulator [Bacteroidota bacterium]
MTHKILLVDDRPENIFVLEQIISSPDRELLKANSGNEALKIAYKNLDISLILLDVQMPD